MRNYVIINGVNSLTIKGLAINELPPIIKPPMRVLQEEIDGRDGDITTNLGYGAYDKIMTIGLYNGYDINEIIAFFNEEGTIVFSDEADKYYKFKIIEQIDYEALIKFRTASVTFHCQPFKYPLSESPIVITPTFIEEEGETLTLNDTEYAPMQVNLKGNTSQASEPTPSTPVDVSVVSGDNTINIMGSNLANIRDTLITTEIKGLTFVYNNDGSFSYSGTLANHTYLTFTNRFYNKLEAGTYTFSIDKTLAYKLIWNMTFEDGTTDYFTLQNGSTSRTVTISKNIVSYYFDFTGMTVGTTYNDTLKLMLNKGSSPMTFEPYTGQSQLISLGVENLLTNNVTSQTINAIEFTKNNDKSIYANGTASARTDLYFVGDGSNYEDLGLMAGTYTLSGCYSGGSNTTYMLLCVVQHSDTTTTTYADYGDSTTIQVQSGDKFRIFIRVANGKSVDGTFYPQLEKGTKKNSYTPYGTTPIELCKIEKQDHTIIAQDYFYPSNDKWYKHSEVGKDVLDGSESWSYISVTQGSLFRSNNAITDEIKNDTYSPLCNYYIGIPYQNYQSRVNNNIYINSTNNFVDVIDNRYTSDTNFTNWLSSNNVLVYYVLATPTNTEITDSTLISQLNNLANVNSYEGQTNISQENNDKAFILGIKAMQNDSDKAIINNIGNIYSKPTIDIEGTGIVDVYLGENQILSANVDEEIIIDSTNLEAYKPDGTLANRQITGNISNLKLPTGNTTVQVAGEYDKATITNYVRWL